MLENFILTIKKRNRDINETKSLQMPQLKRNSKLKSQIMQILKSQMEDKSKYPMPKIFTKIDEISP